MGSGPQLNIKTVFPGMEIPMLKIRRSWDYLVFNTGIDSDPYTCKMTYLYWDRPLGIFNFTN